MDMSNAHELAKRVTYCYDRYGRRYTCNSAFSSWGRWVVLAVIIGAALVLFFLVS